MPGAKKNGYQGASVTCPHCGYAAPYHDHARRTLVSLFGTLRYRRAYYYCRRCGKGICPFDQQAGLDEHHLSPAVQRLTCLAGSVSPSFEKAGELLEEMSGVRLSESTVERTTETIGLYLADLYKQGITLGPRVSWRWQRDSKGRTVAYVSLDATGTRQQGPGGRHAEGRMAYVGSIFNPPLPEECLQTVPNAKRAALQARYLAGLYALPDMGPLMRQVASRVGMEQAEVWIALTDGGNGLEAFMQQNFNRADLVLILDFYHAASYLEKLAKALHPQDEQASQRQAEQWCSLLKAEGGAVMLEVLRQWDWPTRKSAALREQWEAVLSYFGNNVHRMAYPEYLAEGWHIGSGVVESACKTVVGQRLKGPGMRWGEEGAHALCHV
ncbi:MAG TPA: ISKra4 family transposase, partial [Gemmataceae bacterium]|nr:ISKra4 family transposase [Gemmataceae bacterium]